VEVSSSSTQAACLSGRGLSLLTQCPPGRLGRLTQEWLATSDDPEARTSGGYWHHQRCAEAAAAIHDQRFQDELLDALAGYTASSVRQHQPQEPECTEQGMYGPFHLGSVGESSSACSSSYERGRTADLLDIPISQRRSGVILFSAERLAAVDSFPLW
jgi:hypothetical protein